VTWQAAFLLHVAFCAAFGSLSGLWARRGCSPVTQAKALLSYTAWHIGACMVLWLVVSIILHNLAGLP